MNWYKTSFARMSLEQRIMAILPQLAQAAQKEYDAWEQDENGMNEELGAGGICQNIAEAMANVLWRNKIDATTVSAQIGEQHVWTIAYNNQEAYSIDIPPQVYETGGGYTWKKIPGVVFSPNNIYINRMNRRDFDPEEDY